MKKLLLSMLLGFGLMGLANAVDYAAVRGSNQVVLHSDVACPAELVAMAQERGAPVAMVLLGFEATLDGVNYTGCWTPVYRNPQDVSEGGVIVLIYSDGDIGQVNMDEFHNLKDA